MQENQDCDQDGYVQAQRVQNETIYCANIKSKRERK